MNALNSIEAKEVRGQKEGYRVFTSEKYDKDIGERLIRNSSAYILETDRRYASDQPAVHLVGYVNTSDSSGASGLELQYDDELSMLDKQVSATADVNGRLLQGTGLTVTTAADTDSSIKSGISTTLDLSLQLKVEEILRKSDYDGAVIVSESGTGDILACASVPVFDPIDVNRYIDSNSGELINKVTQGEYPPGSVFKIIVAAAALEEGISPETTFVCSGREVLDGNVVKCSTGTESGHGDITFEEAFGDSCNCAFIQIAQEIGAGCILDMAEAMGLGSLVLSGYPGEKNGNLMKLSESTGAAIANLALGQGETLVTPLQVARATGIVAAGGIDHGLRVVTGEREIEEAVRVISEETADKLKIMMIRTMQDGTGRTLKADITMAAKTGSAESTQGGVPVVHGWMTGYVPAENPEYVVTVFVEDGKSGSGSAGPIFEKIAQYLNGSGMVQGESSL